jgi:hypothetical protein
MKAFRTRAPYVVALLAILVAACAIDSAPSGPASPGSVADGTPVPDSSAGPSATPLYRCETPSFGSVTKIIGPAGGEINVGPHSLRVPGNALRDNVTITATASAGQYVRIELEPHGLEFERPAELTLSYEHCSTLPPKGRYVAYVDDLGNVLELLDVKFHRSGTEVETHLKHFSGYAIAD